VKELSQAGKEAVLERMAEEWRQILYNGEIMVRVAENIDDDKMRAAGVERMTRAERALDVLEKELEGVEKSTADDGNTR